MPYLDTERNEVVIRVVYDGPPEAGKTTSMRALATSFSQPTITPEENADGRTQWFDWMEYVGGRFEGAQIRCQIVSVPGQRELARRREALLASADVIVFVGDTARPRWHVSLEYLLELRQHAAGIVFQANKRDVADAVPLPEIRRQLGEARWEIGIVEAVAAEGVGIREAFVYAVRLALERVRALTAERGVPKGRPAHVPAAELLAFLRDAEQPTLEASLEASIDAALEAAVVMSNERSVAAALIHEVLAAEVDVPRLPPIPPPPRALGPRPPDATVPSGAIWPPVEGRAILLEVAQIELVPRRHANGDWSAGLGSGWRLVSKRDAVFDSLDAGRNALVQWARLHAACTAVVSPHRCIVLAATGDGRWRLWQIVRAEESLRDLVERASSEVETEVVVERLCQTAQLLLEIHERIADTPCELPVSLDTVGVCDASGMYIGLMPESLAEPAGARVASPTLLADELGTALSLDVARRDELGRVLQQKPKTRITDAVIQSLRLA